ncbi:MAG TPA: carboxyl transferase domain-containing protein, partial [Acidobacteriaceae bacterium]|nr:carboxyl transferase domain-containing protein [Acidobacteriaceae bacterium]
RFIFAWPTARYAVMSGAAAASTLVEIKVKQLERGGQQVTGEEKARILSSIQSAYDQQTDCRYAAARLWVDAVLDPAKTRDALVMALEAASLNPTVRRFHPGVLQT